MTTHNRKWWVLAGATLLYLATTADGPNFNAALPAIQDYFDASAGQIQLLTTVAQLCVAAFVLAAGSLGDLYGRKRIFLLGGGGDRHRRVSKNLTKQPFSKKSIRCLHGQIKT